MGVGQPCVDRPHRHLDREACKERQPQQRLRAADDLPAHHLERAEGEAVAEHDRDVRRLGIVDHVDHRHQHQQRAEQRVEEELVGRVDPVLPAPDADDQEHRDQAALEEQVEEDDVERHEDADHQRLEDQEHRHVFLDPALDAPARKDADREDQRGQDHERQRQPVDPELVGQAADPGALLHELEVRRVRPGVEAEQQDQRQEERDPGRQEREALGVEPRHLVVAAQEHHQHQRAQKRQEGDE